MQVRIANLPDRHARYLDSGLTEGDQADGRVLLFLHAFPLNADQWLPQLHRLPPGWRGVAPDLRGFRGDRGRLPDTIDDYAVDLLTFMAHLEIRRAVVVGLSMGGYVALAMARRSPDRLAGLVLANTRAGADSSQAAAGRDRLIELARREGAPAVAAEMLPTLLGATTRRSQPDLEDVVRGLIASNSVDAIVAASRAMQTRPDSAPLLATLRCPVLVVGGREDAIIAESEIESMRAAVPGGSSAWIPSAGHLSNLEAPAAFNEALGRFLLHLDAGKKTT